MEIEYESPPRFPQNAAAGPSYSDEEDEVEIPEEAEEPVEQEEAEVDDDEEEGVEAQAAPKAKAKRVIKSRQSLSEKQPGTTLFPIARIKKIIKADKEVDTMSAEATFLIAVATEYFIQHFMEEGYTKARLDKRKIVNYRDLASIAQRSDEFSFLQEPKADAKDVVPMPMPISEALEKRKQKQLRDENPTVHDDDSQSTSDILPPLASSKNPLFPNAVIKRPANSHAKGAGKAGQQPKGPSSDQSEEDDIQDVGEGSKPAMAKNGGTPHGHGTRHSRRSMAVGDAEVEVHDTIVVHDDDAMDQD